MGVIYLNCGNWYICRLELCKGRPARAAKPFIISTTHYVWRGKVCHLKLWFFPKLKYNCFLTLCQFLVNSKVIRVHACVCVCVLSHSVVSDWLSVTPCSVAHQAPLSMGFPRQGYRNGLPFSPPGDLPDPGIKPMSPWQEDSLHWATWEALYTDTYTHTCIHIYIHYIYSFPYSFPKSFQDFEYSSLCYTVETINSCLSILFANPKLLIYPSSTLFPLW